MANLGRAYYASGGDYVIVGSCEENVVRVIGSQTGKMLCEVEVDPFDDPVTANFLCEFSPPTPELWDFR